MAKERADVLCVSQGLFESREKAKRAIMAGIVYNENIRIDKAGEKVDSTAELRIKGKQMPYVSRGGLKLEKAINELGFSVKDKVMIDIGSSTGGFTDCALQNGAKFVYALDVGTNQLVWKLRDDERVIVRDKKVQLEVVEKVLLLANSVGFSMTNLSYSPITGGEGNIEFLMLLKYNATKEIENKVINIEHIVNNAHNHFK